MQILIFNYITVRELQKPMHILFQIINIYVTAQNQFKLGELNKFQN